MGIDAPRLLASAKLFLRIGTEEKDEPIQQVCQRVVAALSQPPPIPAKPRDDPEQAAAHDSSDDAEDAATEGGSGKSFDGQGAACEGVSKESIDGETAACEGVSEKSIDGEDAVCEGGSEEPIAKRLNVAS
jgi:hypothetical protein